LIKMETKTMTDEIQTLHQTVLTITRSVTRKGALMAGVAAGAALIYLLLTNIGANCWFMPASIMFGGALGLLNFRWLAFAVERKLIKRIVPSVPANPAKMLLNGMKLMAVFIVLFVVIKWQMVHIFGMVIGLSLSFLAIIWEGLMMLNDAQNRVK
jgi:hypothetical protein